MQHYKHINFLVGTYKIGALLSVLWPILEIEIYIKHMLHGFEKQNNNIKWRYEMIYVHAQQIHHLTSM